MQPVFLLKTYRSNGGHVAGTAGFCVAVPAFYSWSMSEVIDKDTSRQSALIIRIMPVKLHWLWFTSGWPRTGKMIVDAWLGAQYEGGRHQQRVEAITAIEQRRN